MLPRNPHNFGAWINELLLVGNQTDQRAGQHNPVADPDPAHQREHVGLYHRGLSVVRAAREIQIEVLVEAPTDGDFGGRLARDSVETALRLDDPKVLPVLRNRDLKLAPTIIRRLPGSE